MTAVNISGTFRKDERPYNGLEALADQLVDRGKLATTYVVVGIVRPHAIKVSADDGSETPTIRFDRIEPLDGEAADMAQKLLDGAYTGRTGRDPQMQIDFGTDDEDGPVAERTRDEWLGDD